MAAAGVRGVTVLVTVCRSHVVVATSPHDPHGHILSSSGAKSLPTFLMSGILNGGPRVYRHASRLEQHATGRDPAREVRMSFVRASDVFSAQ